MQIIVNTFRWQNFIWFCSSLQRWPATPYTPLLLPCLSLSPLFPFLHSLQLALCQAAFLPAPNLLSLPRSVCAQHKCCQLFTHTEAHTHTHTPRTHQQLPWRLHNVAAAAVAVAVAVAARTANRAISQNFAPSATATSPQTCPKRRGVYKMRTGRDSCPIDSWPSWASEREGEAGSGRDWLAAGIECGLTGHICG